MLKIGSNQRCEQRDGERSKRGESMEKRSLPADVRWGSVVVTHSFLPHGRKLNDLAALLSPLPALFSAKKFCVDFDGSHAATISDVESLLNRLLLKPPFSKSLLISFFIIWKFSVIFSKRLSRLRQVAVQINNSLDEYTDTSTSRARLMSPAMSTALFPNTRTRSFPKLQPQRKQKNSLLTTFFGVWSMHRHGMRMWNHLSRILRSNKYSCQAISFRGK